MSNLINRKSGSAIALSAALAMVIIVVGVAFLLISMFMGGEKEVKNAVDAGALNVGRKVLDDPQDKVTVHLNASDDKQSFFMDVTDNTDGRVTLKNINRVWAKALLLALNADAAGSNAGTGGDDAAAALQGAQWVSDELHKKLVNASNLYGYFTDFAQRNSVRMLGGGGSVDVQSGPHWQTSLLERESESNIQLLQDQINSFSSIGYNLSNDYLTACTREPKPSGASGMTFIKGYRPINVGGKTFWMVPFPWDEKPHLVSEGIFEQNEQPPNMLPAAWDKPVPNGFSVEGKAIKSDTRSQIAMSWVQSNPRTTYQLQIPHGFIKITLQANHWEVFGIDQGTYPCHSVDDDSDWIAIPPQPEFAVAASANVGNEYTAGTLYEALIGPDGDEDPGKVLDFLKQRCLELKPDGNWDLSQALKGCQIDTDTENDQTFLLYFEDQNKLVAKTFDDAVPSGCDKNQPADGNGQVDMGEWSDSWINYGSADVSYNSWPHWPKFSLATVGLKCIMHTHFDRQWTPGTGFANSGNTGGSLGELSVKHTANWTIL